MKAAALVTAAAMLVAAPAGQAPGALRFTRSVDLPDTGLRVKLMPEAKEQPLAPPTTYSYTFTQGGRSSKAELYDPAELWRRSQYAGRWATAEAVLTLAVVRAPLPRGFPREHVAREDYDRAAAAQQVPDPWPAEALARWAADFVGTTGARAEPVARRPFKTRELIAFRFDDRAERRLAFAFRLNPAAAGLYQAPPTWFFVLLELAPSVRPDQARETVLEDFFSSIELAGAAARRGPPPAAPARQAGGAPSVELVASREQIRDSIRNMTGWWSAETPHYIILSNMKTGSRTLVSALSADLEYLRAACETLMPPVAPIRAVSVVRIFSEPADYVRYVGPDRAWTGGLWVSAQRELVVRPLEEAGSRDQRERILRVVYHEGLHQYLFHAFDQLPVSAWFNEGHAAYFENASIGSRRFVIAESAEYAPLLERQAAGGRLDVRPLLYLSLEQFYAGGDEARRLNYALAWGLVYYLRQAVPAADAQPVGTIPARYLAALADTRDGNRATEAAFREVDPELFAREFAGFWTSSNRRGAARRNQPFEALAPPAAD